MKCPYCDRSMICGKIYSASERGVFWLPDNIDISGLKGCFLQKKSIHAAGGIVLDELYPIGFAVKNRPDSFWCENCNIFLTRCNA